MNRFVFVLLFVFLFDAPIAAQEAPQGSAQPSKKPVGPQAKSANQPDQSACPPPAAVEADESIQPPAGQHLWLTKYMLFVIDKSGSMDGKEILQAVHAATCIVLKGSDDFYIRVIAFDEVMYLWTVPEAYREDGLCKWWAQFPDPRAAAKIESWLRVLPAKGSTKLLEPLRVALADPNDQLSLVIISDGWFHEKVEEIVATVQLGQQQRQDRGLSLAKIVIIGVGSCAKDNKKIGILMKARQEVVFCHYDQISWIRPEIVPPSAQH